MSEVAQNIPQTQETAPARRQRKVMKYFLIFHITPHNLQTSSTVDLRKMSQMHESMVQKLDVRHLDMTEELADIEKKSGEEVKKKEDQ